MAHDEVTVAPLGAVWSILRTTDVNGNHTKQLLTQGLYGITRKSLRYMYQLTLQAIKHKDITSFRPVVFKLGYAKTC